MRYTDHGREVVGVIRILEHLILRFANPRSAGNGGIFQVLKNSRTRVPKYPSTYLDSVAPSVRSRLLYE